MIIHFHIQEYFRLAAVESARTTSPHERSTSGHRNLQPRSSPARSTAPSNAGQAFRKTLLDTLNSRFGLRVKDFGISWRDGEAFLALIDAIDPSIGAREKGRAVLTNRARLQLAFDLAETLGIKKLLDAEDIDVPDPDERSVMTYVCQFLQQRPPVPRASASSTPEIEALKAWLNSVLRDGITVNNFSSLKNDYLKYKVIFDRNQQLLSSDVKRNFNLIENELVVAKQALEWINRAEELLKSYMIPTSGDQVEEQLMQHKLFFSQLPELESNAAGLLQDIKQKYNNTIALSNQWETAMLEAMNRWNRYNQAHEALKQWLITAENKLAKITDAESIDTNGKLSDAAKQKRISDLNEVKSFFNNKKENEPVLNAFVRTCEDVLATLPETHQNPLRSTLRNLETRYHEICDVRAPQHLIRYEFDLTEEDFAERLIINVSDPIVLAELESLEKLASDLLNKFRDNSLIERAESDRNEYEKRKNRLHDTDLNKMQQETIKLLHAAEENLIKLTEQSKIEIFTRSSESINEIRSRLEQLKKLSNESGGLNDLGLREIEDHIQRLEEQLKYKRKMRAINWLEREAPEKLARVRDEGIGNEELRKEIEMYKCLIKDESEIIKKIELIDSKRVLVEVEQSRYDDIPSATSSLKSLKKVHENNEDIVKLITHLQETSLRRWTEYEEKRTTVVSKIKSTSKENEPLVCNVSDLRKVFNENKESISKLASERVMRSLENELTCLRDQLAGPRKTSGSSELFTRKESIVEYRSSTLEETTISRSMQVCEVISGASGVTNESEVDEKRLREERRRLEEEERRKREEEIRKRCEEEEAKRKKREEEEIKRKIEEEERRRISEENRKKAEEEARKRREEEDKRRRAVEEEKRKKREEEEIARRAAEDARRKAEEEARIREAEEARAKAEEEARKAEEAENARRAEEDARRKKEEEIKRQKEAEEARREEEKRNRLAQRSKRVNDLLETIQRIQVVLKYDKLADFVSVELPAASECTLEKAVNKKTLYQQQMNQLEPIQQEIMKLEAESCTDDDQCGQQGDLDEVKSLFAGVKTELETCNWDSVISAIKEMIKLKSWINDCSTLRKEFNEKEQLKEHSPQDIVSLSSNIDSLISKSKSIELHEIERYVKVSDKITEECDDLSRMKDRLSQLQEQYSTLQELKNNFNGLLDQFEQFVQQSQRKLAASLAIDITNASESLIKFNSNISALKMELTDEESTFDQLNKLSEEILNRDVHSTETAIKLNNVSVLFTQLKAVISAKLNSLATCSNLISNCDGKCKELQVLLDESNNVKIKPSTMLQQIASMLSDFKLLQEEVVRKLNDTSEISDSWPINLDSKFKLLTSAATDVIGRFRCFCKNLQTLDESIETCRDNNTRTGDEIKVIEGDTQSTSADDKLNACIELLARYEESEMLFLKLNDQLEFISADIKPVDKNNFNIAIKQIKDTRTQLKEKLIKLKSDLAEKAKLMQEYNEYARKLTKQMDDIEYGLVDASLFTASLDGKKSQLDKARSIRSKLNEINLKVISRAPEFKVQLDNLKTRQEMTKVKVAEVIECNERAYKDHLSFKEACNDLASWMRSIRDKIPSLSAGNLSDRLSIETSVATFTQLQSHRPTGQSKLENVKKLAAQADETSSVDGKILIQNNVENLEKDFTIIFNGIDKTINELHELQKELKVFREEYEEVNEWLQQKEKEIKQERSACRGSTLDEKLENVASCSKLSEEFDKMKNSQIKKLADKEFLLKSHLEGYIRNQLKLIDSRYQVLLNLLKEVSAKVNEIADNHSHFAGKLADANAYINAAKNKVSGLESHASDRKKEELESALKICKELSKKNSEQGQGLVHAALYAGEKALLSTPGGGREVINMEIHDIQSKWDRFLIQLQELTSNLEAALIRLQDHEAQLIKINSWLGEHEKRLTDVMNKQELTMPPTEQVSKAKLRRLDSLLQEVLSYENVIANFDRTMISNDDVKIKNRYDKLVDQVKCNLHEAHTRFDQLEDFNCACENFSQWLAGSKERLSSYSVLNEDKETVCQKSLFLKQLLDEDEGMEKLRLAARLCQLAKSGLSETLSSSMDARVAKLQSEYDSFKEILEDMKASLDVAMAKWNEYEEQYAQCESFVDQMEPKAASFRELYPDLLTKRSKLEEFQQTHLQNIFAAQSEFNRLNLKAQLLLESYSNGNINQAVSILCSRYNSLVGHARDVLHTLEQRYQEHQQLQNLTTESTEFLESSKDKIESFKQLVKSKSLDDLNHHLASLRSLISSVEQASESKIHYLLELADKVIICTSSNGANTIKDEVDAIKSEYCALVKSLNDLLGEYNNRISHLSEFDKFWKQFTTWFQVDLSDRYKEITATQEGRGGAGTPASGMQDTKASTLAKLRNIEKDIQSKGCLIGKIKEYESSEPVVKDFLESTLYPFMSQLTAAIKELDDEMKEEEAYRSSRDELENYLKQIRIELESITQGLTSVSVAQGKLKRVCELKNIDWDSKLQQLESMRGFLASKDKNSAELEPLSFELNRIKSLLSNAQDILIKSINAWTEYEMLFDRLTQWLSGFENRLKGDCSSLKSMLGDLDETGEKLYKLIDCDEVRNHVISINTHYMTLMNHMTELLSKVDRMKTLKDPDSSSKRNINQWLQNLGGQGESSTPSIISITL